MTEWLIKYGQYAAILTGVLLLVSARLEHLLFTSVFTRCF
jgi:hypothetical protein